MTGVIATSPTLGTRSIPPALAAAAGVARRTPQLNTLDEAVDPLDEFVDLERGPVRRKIEAARPAKLAEARGVATHLERTLRIGAPVKQPDSCVLDSDPPPPPPLPT